MRYLIFSLFITAILVFSSCERGNDNVRPENDREEERDRLNADCYDFVYPITYLMPDDTEITGNNESEIGSQIRVWYADNPDVTERPNLQFPLDVVIGDQIITLENSEDLRRIEARCQEERENCYEFVFPITYILPDGTEITGNSESEIARQIRIWYEDHPNATERPTLKFPVDIIIGDEIVTLESEEDLARINERCSNGNSDFDCPDLGQNIGDVCRDGDGNEGIVNSDCECE